MSSRAIDPQWGESGLNLYNSNELTFFHAHLCSKHFSECDFANPMEYRMGFASKLTRCYGTLLKSCLTGSNWYGCILVGLSGKVSVSSSELELAILQQLPRVTWFGRHGEAFGTTENAFFHAFISLRSQFHLHHRSQRALMEIVSKITPNLGLLL